ncbi:hypothetical protein WR25_15777 [Diploscapter pachys]|uniref:Uncharacterized protein n=1 Tax=Diploscapter pachys TaxID=2018661 RepID=A0A2A2JXB2_9BILA|nr:hypothetical protein WR25_15777 [Diploscapter pachys]
MTATRSPSSSRTRPTARCSSCDLRTFVPDLLRTPTLAGSGLHALIGQLAGDGGRLAHHEQEIVPDIPLAGFLLVASQHLVVDGGGVEAEGVVPLGFMEAERDLHEVGERITGHFITVAVAAPVGFLRVALRDHHERDAEIVGEPPVIGGEVAGGEITLPMGSPDFDKLAVADVILAEWREVDRGLAACAMIAGAVGDGGRWNVVEGVNPDDLALLERITTFLVRSVEAVCVSGWCGEVRAGKPAIAVLGLGDFGD